MLEELDVHVKKEMYLFSLPHTTHQKTNQKKKWDGLLEENIGKSFAVSGGVKIT